jgi:hypothetical protein
MIHGETGPRGLAAERYRPDIHVRAHRIFYSSDLNTRLVPSSRPAARPWATYECPRALNRWYEPGRISIWRAGAPGGEVSQVRWPYGASAADAARAYTPDARLQGALGAAARGCAGPPAPALSRGVGRGLAPAPGPGPMRSDARAGARAGASGQPGIRPRARDRAGHSG